MFEPAVASASMTLDVGEPSGMGHVSSDFVDGNGLGLGGETTESLENTRFKGAVASGDCNTSAVKWKVAINVILVRFNS